VKTIRGVAVATSVALIVLGVATGLAATTVRDTRSAWLYDFLLSISSGIIGGALSFIAIAFLYDAVVDRINRQDSHARFVRELLADARAEHRSAAKLVAMFRELGLLDDGSVANQSFHGLHLAGCDFDGADLRGCDFTDSDLTGSRFVGAKVDGCNFDRATLKSATLDFHSAAGATFRHAKM
jgi:uncharacterized protein YjbI with pentapeptide repeats